MNRYRNAWRDSYSDQVVEAVHGGEAVDPRDSQTQRIAVEPKQGCARILDLAVERAMIVRRLEDQETEVRLGEQQGMTLASEPSMSQELSTVAG